MCKTLYYKSYHARQVLTMQLYVVSLVPGLSVFTWRLNYFAGEEVNKKRHVNAERPRPKASSVY